MKTDDNDRLYSEFNESAILLQNQMLQRMQSINEQLQEWEKDPKMRGGKRYTANIRSFCQLAKKYSENLGLVKEVEHEEGGAQRDIISLLKWGNEEDEELKKGNPKLWQELQSVEEKVDTWREGYRKQKLDPEVTKKMLLTIKDAKEIKRTLMVRR